MNRGDSDADPLEVAVAVRERTLRAAVTDALEAAPSVTATPLESGSAAIEYGADGGVDGVVVDGHPGTDGDPVPVGRLVDRLDPPAVALADDEAAVSAALEAGAVDVLPRVATPEGCELLVDRLAAASNGAAGSATDNDAGSEDGYREVLENVSDGLVVHDPETAEIVDVNERFCEMNGYDREELLGEHVGIVTAAEEGYGPEAAAERVEQAREEGAQLFEWRNRRRNGETFPVEVHLAVVELGGDERVLASVRDITERKHRERELRESERRLRLIAEHIDEIIYLSTADFSEILYINPAYEDIYGQPVEALYEHPRAFVEAAHPADRDRYEADVEELVADVEAGETDGSYGGEYRLEVDGETRWVRVARFPVEDENGAVDRIVGRVRDVTERRELERTYQDIFEHVGDGLVVHDPETGEILEVNDRYCEVTGYSAAELEGSDVDIIVASDTEDAREAALQNIERAREEGPQLFEFDGQRKDGTTFTGEVHLSLVELRGEERVLASVRDVTERKRREREFEQIFNGVHGGITINDPETGELLDVNDSFCDLLGYDRETVLEMGVAGVSAPGEEFTMARARDLVHEVMESGDSRQFEWAVETADGERRWLEVRGTPAEIGGQARYVSVTRDVTERRRREREYEQIFNGVTDGIAIQDPETAELLDANRTFAERLGYDDVEAVLEQGFEELNATEAGYTEARARELCHRVMETGESETVEWAMETKDGDRLLAEATVSPAVIGGEERIVSIQRDVTERRRLEGRLRTIAERIEEMIHFVDVESEEVLFVNDSFTDIFGRPVEALYEDPGVLFDAVHPEDLEPHRAELRAMFDDMWAGDPEDSYGFEFRIQRPDGETRWLESSVYPVVDETSESMRYVAVTKDVTARHRRERTLETFHEATRQLTAADSRREACRQAVRAAEEVLGFPLVSAHLYDESTGRLEPRAVTDRLSELGVDPPAFGAGDSLPWQAFVEGESVTDTRAAADVYGPGVSGPDVVLPLGSHGVMLVGAPEGTFDAEAVELAQILAATLEAALNHVAGERELEEREAELRREQARADRLERLNTIIRDIEQATVERSSRTGIEEAVCERLVEVDGCDLVWVGEAAVGDGGLVPRTAAGDREPYLDALTGAADGGDASVAGGHPAAAAYREEAPTVVENVATEAAAGDWRTHALRHGVQSAVAVPIRYETTVHGVLAVESDEPDAFDGATREVLAELGRSIGYAVTVTERERALESEGTTELEFSVADDGLFLVRGSAAADCRVSLERTVRRTGGSFSTFYLVEGADPAELVELADAAPSVETAQVVSADDDGEGGLLEVTAPTWFGSVFTDGGAVVREATVEAGRGSLVVEAPRGADVRSLVEGFQERYPDSDLEAQRQRERAIASLFELRDALREELTDRQWETLETAYSAGYFAWPREVSGEGVADLLGVSQPTFNKHLRIAERTAFELLLDRADPTGGA